MKLLGLFLFFWLTFLAPAWSGTSVRIALDQSPPTSYFDNTGHPKGFFPDLFSHVSKELNWSITYVPCNWQQCLNLLEAGEVDVLPGIAYTEERSRRFSFSNEVVLSSWGQIFTLPDFELKSILDLNQKKIAVLSGDVYLQGEHGLRNIARQFDIAIELISVSSYAEAFELVTNGQADAAMAGRIFGLKNRHKFNLVPTSILIHPIQARPAFSHLAPANLNQDFSRLLQQWKKDSNSNYYRLIDKWLSEELHNRLPSWLWPATYGVLLLFVLLTAITLITRSQIKKRTLELAEKNHLLEQQLAAREKIEKELFERQQQYKVFFDNSHSVMFFIDPDNGQIVDANNAACEFYQYNRQQLQAMKISQLNSLTPEEIAKALEKARNNKQRRFEFTHQKSTGERCPVEVYSSPIQIGGRPLLCSIVHDISQRKQAEQEVAAHTDFLQAVIDGVSDPLMVISRNHKILQMNQTARQLNKEGADKNLKCHNLSHNSENPCGGKDHPCPLEDVLESGEPVTMIHHHFNDQNEKRICEITASPLRNPEGYIYAIIEVVRDITERMQVEELLNENEKRLLHLAHHDSLTGLPNRLLFEDRLNHALSKARRSGRQVALFFLDLDHFKAINDNLGHDYGDHVLINASERLSNCVRESDTVARMGGDEFLILLEEVETIDLIETTAQRVSASLKHEIREGDFRQEISSSIGIAIYPDDASTSQELLKHADIAMYKAKREGRANYQFYASPQAQFIFD